MSHTPGPWGFARADRNSGLRPVVTQLQDGSATGKTIAIVGDSRFPDGLMPDSSVYADARLISAAPDLLALVERFRDMYDVSGDPVGVYQDGRLRDRVRAAIAKATGSTGETP